MVRQYFKGYLKPPFDTSGRTIAGMTKEVELFFVCFFFNRLFINDIVFIFYFLVFQVVHAAREAPSVVVELKPHDSICAN